MKTLLLNANYQVLTFISERRAIKLLLSDKVELLSSWEAKKISFASGFVDHPATLRMKYLIKLNPTKLNFSRNLVLRRDAYQCAYCGKKLTPNRLTIDHVVPRSAGGENSFYNCVASCTPCNNRKANKSLEESGMTLRVKPLPPKVFLCSYPPDTQWHEGWLFFLET